MRQNDGGIKMENIQKFRIGLFIAGTVVALLLISKGLTSQTYNGGLNMGLGIGMIFFQLLFFVEAIAPKKCTYSESLQE